MPAFKLVLSGLLAGAVGLGLGATAASATPLSSLTADYFVMASTNTDVGNGIDGGTVTGLVGTMLGADGLPVYSGHPAPNSGAITDVNGSNEILWWTPHSNASNTVTALSSGTVTLPYGQNLYPNGSFDGSDGYVSAHLFGGFTLASAGSITLSLGSDDDAFVFIDGQLTVDNGGVHADTVVPTTTDPIAAGFHRIDVFFADRHVTGSRLDFNGSVAFSAVPEPASLVLLGAGLAGLGMIRRKRTA